MVIPLPEASRILDPSRLRWRGIPAAYLNVSPRTDSVWTWSSCVSSSGNPCTCRIADTGSTSRSSSGGKRARRPHRSTIGSGRSVSWPPRGPAPPTWSPRSPGRGRRGPGTPARSSGWPPWSPTAAAPSSPAPIPRIWKDKERFYKLGSRSQVNIMIISWKIVKSIYQLRLKLFHWLVE